MINVINEIRERLDFLESMVKDGKLETLTDNVTTPSIEYVNLREGTNKDKLHRIVEQVVSHKINILTTPQISNHIRNAIVAELGEDGLVYWLKLRQFREGYDQEAQTSKYNYALKHRSKNTMTFGAIINRYKEAINEYNKHLV